MTSIRRRYAALAASNILSSGFGFATASVVAWKFGAAGLGTTAMAASLIAYATLTTACGTEIHAVRIGAAGHHPLDRLASSVMAIRLALATLCYAGVIAITFIVPEFRAIRALVLVFGLSVFTTAADLTWLPQAIHRTNVVAGATLATQSANFLLLVLALGMTSRVSVVPAARVAAEALTAAGLLLWMLRTVGPLRAPLRPRELSGLLRDSATIGGTQLLRGLAIGSDLILLGLFVAPTAVGLYAAAFKIFQLLLGFAASYFIILLPRIAERSHDGRAMAEELRGSLRRVLPLALVAMLVLALVAGPMLRLLFGQEFGGAATPMRILALALLINVTLRHYRQVLLARGLQRTDWQSSLIGGAVHVAAKLALIPSLGIVGAALGTLVGETALLCLQRRAALRAIATPIS